MRDGSHLSRRVPHVTSHLRAAAMLLLPPLFPPTHTSEMLGWAVLPRCRSWEESHGPKGCCSRVSLAPAEAAEEAGAVARQLSHSRDSRRALQGESWSASCGKRERHGHSCI